MKTNPKPNPDSIFLKPGFNGWMGKPCSLCGKVHPSVCGTSDPRYGSGRYEGIEADTKAEQT